MEADISIWRKTGHFYFALTRTLRAEQKTPGLAAGFLSGMLGGG
jgi:hypothetical protein